jgi:hypothetical protein
MVLAMVLILIVVLFSSSTLLVVAIVRLAFSSMRTLFAVISSFFTTYSRNSSQVFSLVNLLNVVNRATELSFLILSSLTAI